MNLLKGTFIKKKQVKKIFNFPIENPNNNEDQTNESLSEPEKIFDEDFEYRLNYLKEVMDQLGFNYFLYISDGDISKFQYDRMTAHHFKIFRELIPVVETEALIEYEED